MRAPPGGSELPRYRHVAAACAVLAAVVLAGCSSDDSAQPAPTATPSPTPPRIEPVDADEVVTVTSLSAAPLMDRSAKAGPDQAAIDAFVGAVTGWLDEHLEDLQAGGGGQLGEVAAVGLLDQASPAVLDGVKHRLLGPEAPQRGVTYDIEVGHNGPPHWARVIVSVNRTDGETRSATFVFLPNDDPGAVLVALEPGEGA